MGVSHTNLKINRVIKANNFKSQRIGAVHYSQYKSKHGDLLRGNYLNRVSRSLLVFCSQASGCAVLTQPMILYISVCMTVIMSTAVCLSICKVCVFV